MKKILIGLILFLGLTGIVNAEYNEDYVDLKMNFKNGVFADDKTTTILQNYGLKYIKKDPKGFNYYTYSGYNIKKKKHSFSFWVSGCNSNGNNQIFCHPQYIKVGGKEFNLSGMELDPEKWNLFTFVSDIDGYNFSVYLNKKLLGKIPESKFYFSLSGFKTTNVKRYYPEFEKISEKVIAEEYDNFNWFYNGLPLSPESEVSDIITVNQKKEKVETKIFADSYFGNLFYNINPDNRCDSELEFNNFPEGKLTIKDISNNGKTLCLISKVDERIVGTKLFKIEGIASKTTPVKDSEMFRDFRKWYSSPHTKDFDPIFIILKTLETSNSKGIMLTDMNGDSLPDIIYALNGRYYVMINKGNFDYEVKYRCLFVNSSDGIQYYGDCAK